MLEKGRRAALEDYTEEAREKEVGPRPLDERETPKMVRWIEITAEMDRHAVEALYLQIRALAKRYGANVREFRTEKVGEDFTSIP